MTIYIANNIVDIVDSLAANTRTLLQVVPGGLDWCKRAIAAEDIRYKFATEKEFVKSFLIGLRGAELLPINPPGLFVAPEKLNAMKSDDLRDLYDYSQNMTGDPPLAITQILNRNELVDNKHLTSVDAFLNEKKINDNPIFTFATFSDRIHFYKWLTEKNSDAKSITSDAIDFSLSRSISTAEFVNLCAFYSACVKNREISSETKVNQKKAVDAIYQILSPVVENTLACPQVTHPLAETELKVVVDQWIDNGNQLGFSDITTGLRQLAKMIPLDNVRVASLTNLAKKEINRIQRCLRKGTAVTASLSQDGFCWRYQYQNPEFEAVLNLNNNGCLTVAEYAPL